MTDIIYRTFSQSEPKISKDKKEITFPFASDFAVQRHFGMEILGMSPENIDRERVDSNNLPLLMNHDTNRAIGAVQDIWQEGNRSYAGVKLSHVKDAEDLVTDWSSGIRTGVSVGYTVKKMQRVRKGDPEQGEPDTYRASLWKPMEISVGVACPADPYVGIGRAADEQLCYRSAAFTDESGKPIAAVKSAQERMLEEVRQEVSFTLDRKEAGVSIETLRIFDRFLRLSPIVRERALKAK